MQLSPGVAQEVLLSPIPPSGSHLLRTATRLAQQKTSNIPLDFQTLRIAAALLRPWLLLLLPFLLLPLLVPPPLALSAFCAVLVQQLTQPHPLPRSGSRLGLVEGRLLANAERKPTLDSS